MNTITLLEEDKQKDLLRFVTAGSVDDGKSTLIGRLLYESKGIYEDQLDSVIKASGRWGTVQDDVDFALVTDGLKAEREQGITIDVAYRYFTTPKRKFIIADSPGHVQYTRNMATGASTANLSIILVDAENGVLTQSKRHTFITSLLGIPHIVVAINKMDLVNYSQEVYEKICVDFTEFAAKLEVTDITFIPVSALKGDNVVEPSANMPWYKGSTLLNHLENVHIASDRNFIDLRFPVQYVLRPDRTFRGYLGSVASGSIKPGQEIMVIPSGVKTKVKTVFDGDGELKEAFPPLSVGITTEDEIDISRGDMLVHVHNIPKIGRTIDSMVVWMSEEPLNPEKDYYIKHTTKIVSGRVSTLHYKVDVNTLHRTKENALNLNEIGRCVFTLNQPIAHDAYSKNRYTGSFIIIDRITNNTVGAGMILDRDSTDFNELSRAKSEPKSKHIESHASLISTEERIKRMGTKPLTIWLTGLVGSGKTTVAYNLEKKIFDAGLNAYVIDGENARLGFSKDLGFSAEERSENIRRAAEFARMLNDAGMIAICSFLSPYESQRKTARDIIGEDKYIEVYLSAPLKECRKRSKSNIYDKADSGEISNFSGVTSPYEVPGEPALTLPTHKINIEESVNKLMQFILTLKP